MLDNQKHIDAALDKYPTLEPARVEIDHLRAGVTRIADGYGGDVQSLARSLLEGKV